MTTSIEERLRRTLAAEAERAELTAHEWSARPARRPPRSVRLLVASAIVVAVAASVVGVGVLRRPATIGEPQPAFLPAGAEQPLTPIPIDDLDWSPEPLVVGPTRPGSLGAYVVDGEQLAVWDTIETGQSAEVREVRCVEVNRDRACSPPGVGRPSLDVNAELWIWTDLPAGTAFVTVQAPGVAAWQRPIGGIAALAVDHRLETVVTAVGPDGSVLVRYDRRSLIAAAIEAVADAPHDDLDDAEQREIAGAVAEVALLCLDEAGLGGAVVVRPTDDSDDIWSQCVVEASAAGAAQFTRLGGQDVASPELDPSFDGHDFAFTEVALCVLPPVPEDLCGPVVEGLTAPDAGD